MSVEESVSERYSQGAIKREESLCCPVDYDATLLKLLPREIVERDYGCGDPSRYVRSGDVVLDLGSGGGKICYMAAQLVGDKGRVIGVDMTDDMLSLARSHQQSMAEKLGGDRVEFNKGYIQDLALNVEALAAKLQETPVTGLEQLNQIEAWKQQQRLNEPMIADQSVSLVISNCVLNLVDKCDRQQMISEIFRVLKPGGRVAISDIVSDEHVPKKMQEDPTLWSGCISGAFQEQEFLQAFLDAGFVAVGYDKWEDRPWQVIENIEFRSVTLVATRPVTDHLYDAGQAVLYKGPYREVRDDFGNSYPRGVRVAVSRRTFELIKNNSSYASDFIGIEPAKQQNLGCFCKPAATVRPASETRGGRHIGTGTSEACC